MKPPSRLIPSHPAYNAPEHLKHVQALLAKYPYATEAQCTAALPDIMQEICRSRFPHQIAKELGSAVRFFLCQNDIFFDGNPLEEEPDYLSRRAVTLGSATWHREAIRRTVEIFRLIVAKLPASVFEKDAGTMRVPLYDLMEDVPDIIMQISARALASYENVPVFDLLKYQLRRNCIEASGYDVQTYENKPLTFAFESKLQGAALIHEYLRGTAFETLLTIAVPFVIPRKTWAHHGVILAPPGHGKTQLLGSVVASFLQEADSPGIFLIDPHGDLFSVLKDRVPAERLVALDPDTNPPPLNFLDFGSSTEPQVLQTFSYLMSSLSGGLTDKQGAIVPYLLKLLRRIPDASLDTLRQIVDEKVKAPKQSRFHEHIAALSPVDQGFFESQFYGGRMEETKQAIGWKLYSALSSDAFRQMFSAKHNSFSADEAMRERKVVLVKGARRSLGDEGMSVFLQFITAQFFAAALRRDELKPEERRLCILFIDEAHHVFNAQTANILTECRKYGLAWVGASQVLAQIPEEVKAAIYGATAIKIAGPVSHSDAVVLSREMHATLDFLRSMKARERESADWAFYVQNVTPHAIKVTVPYGVLEGMPKAKTPPSSMRAGSPTVAHSALPEQSQTREAGVVAAAPRASRSDVEGDSDQPAQQSKKPEPHDPDQFPERW